MIAAKKLVAFSLAVFTKEFIAGTCSTHVPPNVSDYRNVTTFGQYGARAEVCAAITDLRHQSSHRLMRRKIDFDTNDRMSGNKKYSIEEYFRPHLDFCPHVTRKFFACF